MKLTNKQQQDLETVMYFIPEEGKTTKITWQDIEMFFENSEKGLHKEKIDGTYINDGFNALLEGKRWRGIHMGMWEEGVLDGTTPYFTLLGGTDGERKWYNPMRYFKGRFYTIKIPKSVVEFMKREMFKGKSAEIIEKAYLSFKNW